MSIKGFFMISIRHQNGTIYIQDGHVKLEISNHKQIYEMIEKIKKFSYHIVDDDGCKKRIMILDLLQSAKQKIIKYKESRCIGN